MEIVKLNLTVVCPRVGKEIDIINDGGGCFSLGLSDDDGGQKRISDSGLVLVGTCEYFREFNFLGAKRKIRSVYCSYRQDEPDE